MALSSFVRVNDVVSVRSPATDSASQQSLEGQRPSKAVETATSPQTVLFLSWGEAKPRFIEKYTNLYAELYPSAKVILVQSGMKDFFWRSDATCLRLAEPAAKMLAETTDDTLLVHVMSNAGSKQWCNIDKALSHNTGRSLSSATTVVDSAPGRANFSQTWASLAGSLPKSAVPRMALTLILGSFLCLLHLQKALLPGPDLLERVRMQMNQVPKTGAGARRSYIYAQGDQVIGWEDVESHAKEAETNGWVVKLVKYEGSSHVGHFKQDPQLYRETIEKTWKAKL